MRIGEDEGAAAAQLAHFVGNAQKSAATEDDPTRQRCEFECFHDFVPDHGRAAPSSSIICFLIWNFWTLPVTVVGNSLTMRMWRGTL